MTTDGAISTGSLYDVICGGSVSAMVACMVIRLIVILFTQGKR